MTMDIHRRREILLLCGLLLADALFYFAVIPYGIQDPEGFGLDQGLPPSFSAHVAAILIALIMAIRLVSLLKGGVATVPDEEAETGPWLRNAAGIGVALVFAVILVPLAGYYVAGICLILALMVVMGEKRWLHLVGQPVVVMGLIWLLFDQIFLIRLPDGMLFDR